VQSAPAAGSRKPSQAAAPAKTSPPLVARATSALAHSHDSPTCQPRYPDLRAGVGYRPWYLCSAYRRIFRMVNRSACRLASRGPRIILIAEDREGPRRAGADSASGSLPLQLCQRAPQRLVHFHRGVAAHFLSEACRADIGRGGKRERRSWRVIIGPDAGEVCAVGWLCSASALPRTQVGHDRMGLISRLLPSGHAWLRCRPTRAWPGSALSEWQLATL
jgi:hypothetical protein